jgi:hypothetical protein
MIFNYNIKFYIQNIFRQALVKPSASQTIRVGQPLQTLGQGIRINDKRGNEWQTRQFSPSPARKEAIFSHSKRQKEEKLGKKPRK